MRQGETKTAHFPTLKPIWTYGVQLWGSASNSNIEILEIFQWKVLRIITDAECGDNTRVFLGLAQVFLGFPVPKSKCCDGSQDSKLQLRASHVAPPPLLKFNSNQLHILCTCKITTATG